MSLVIQTKAKSLLVNSFVFLDRCVNKSFRVLSDHPDLDFPVLKGKFWGLGFLSISLNLLSVILKIRIVSCRDCCLYICVKELFNHIPLILLAHRSTNIAQSFEDNRTELNGISIHASAPDDVSLPAFFELRSNHLGQRYFEKESSVSFPLGKHRQTSVLDMVADKNLVQFAFLWI